MVLFNAAEPKPNADFIFVRLFRVDRADQTKNSLWKDSIHPGEQLRSIN